MTKQELRSPKALAALHRIRNLRQLASETGANTKRAERFVLNALCGSDQLWVCEQLQQIEPVTSEPKGADPNSGVSRG